uniref:Nuclear receptor domain-containing protein n=1 Tax=Panagrellus redivivus TaxID=6233 RepID=A0A7E4UMV6_PANRE
MTGENDTCLVCQVPTKSIHFQVNCCRACAAFFRRSIKAKHVYHCQRGTGRCELVLRSRSKPICRHCRLKRCIEIGLHVEAETECDSTTSPTTLTPDPVDLAPVEDPISETFSGSPISINGDKVNYDPKPLLNVVKENLLKDNTQSLQSASGVIITPLQRMCHELNKFMGHNPPNPVNITVSRDVIVDDNIRFNEEYLLRLVKLVTSFEHFVKIDNSQKFNIFRHFWATFLCIERIHQSMLMFGTDEKDLRYLLTNRQAIDFQLLFDDPPPKDSENIKMFKPMMERYIRNLINPMKALGLTVFELAFIASHLLWSLYEVNGITSETHKMAEKLMERNAAEMHDYYVYEQKLPNYAARLSAITGLVPVIESILRSRKDLIIVGKFFDFRKIDFFDCELME